jgi:antitoxin VapB
MAFHIRDEETDQLARKLARIKKVGLTEAVKASLRDAVRKEEAKVPLMERLRPILDEIKKYPETGKKADKKFFDDLSGC